MENKCTDTSTSCQLESHVLNQVILELHMSMPIRYFTTKLGKLFKGCRFLVLSLKIFSLKIKTSVVDVAITLILHHVVVHGHTSSRHLPKLLDAPCQRRVLNDTPSRLKNAKNTLTSFLALFCIWANHGFSPPCELSIVFTRADH